MNKKIEKIIFTLTAFLDYFPRVFHEDHDEFVNDLSKQMTVWACSI